MSSASNRKKIALLSYKRRWGAKGSFTWPQLAAYFFSRRSFFCLRNFSYFPRASAEIACVWRRRLRKTQLTAAVWMSLKSGNFCHSLTHFSWRTVWPDARIKSSLIFTNIAQKGTKAVFTTKRRFFKWNKQLPNIWATFRHTDDDRASWFGRNENHPLKKQLPCTQYEDSFWMQTSVGTVPYLYLLKWPLVPISY